MGGGERVEGFRDLRFNIEDLSYNKKMSHGRNLKGRSTITAPWLRWSAIEILEAEWSDDKGFRVFVR